MTSRRGPFWLTFNGEIYNFRLLRRELEASGRTFVSDSDTEVILQAYEEWGDDAFGRLRGMFAFAIWDGRRRSLLLVRDRFGIKPLYVAERGGCFLFASEVRALLASGLIPRRLEATALWQYLGYQTVPAPLTLIEGVRMLEPGHWAAVGPGKNMTVTRYWDPLASASVGGPSITSDQAVEDVRSILDESVRLHLVSDVPVGVFLSGGIDSSAIVAVMREAGVTPMTFSVGSTDPAHDEGRFASQVAERFGASHTHIRLTEDELLEDLPAALDAMDHPTGDGVNSYVVSKAVRRAGVKVALSGLGGDELFGGYPSFARFERLGGPLARWGATPQVLRDAAAGLVRALDNGVVASKAASVLESDGSLAEAWPITRQLLSPLDRRRLLAPEWTARVRTVDPYAVPLAAAYADAPHAEVWSRVSYAETRAYMHDVLLRDADQMSMAHGLEVRVPFLDHRLAEYVFALPDACKKLDSGPKPLLVRALNGSLPHAIVNRPKRGFTLPFDPWMRSSLKDLCAAHLGPEGLEGRGLFRASALRAMWAGFLAGGRETTWSRIWMLVALDAWLERQGVEVGPES
jgi:asparagine synthase (glutamine-hydrolysing)